MFLMFYLLPHIDHVLKGLVQVVADPGEEKKVVWFFFRERKNITIVSVVVTTSALSVNINNNIIWYSFPTYFLILYFSPKRSSST